MAKTKQDWLKEAKALGLKLAPKDKIADIRAAIEAAQVKPTKQAPIDKPPATAEEPKPSTIAQPPTPSTAKAGGPVEALAKAGKRSKKGLEEADIKAAKESRKRGEPADQPEPPVDMPKKGPVPATRPKIERRSKDYRLAAEKIDKAKDYELKDALKLACETSAVKFDATVELHVRLAVDPKQADQNIRESVALPNGTGKSLSVAVFAEPDDQAKAKVAGADFVGEKELLDKLEKADLDFDVLIATPQLMSQLGRFAKLLGPKGLMPNPKSGTVTKNVPAAVKLAKAGQVEFRVDANGNVHIPIGKVSFGPDKLMPNAEAVLAAVKAAKPSSISGGYVLSSFVTTTMGPSLKFKL
ncbi:MAG TPA: 50S ribosomal protein L1 [Candidatus Saccharimonadales bacterium]